MRKPKVFFEGFVEVAEEDAPQCQCLMEKITRLSGEFENKDIGGDINKSSLVLKEQILTAVCSCGIPHAFVCNKKRGKKAEFEPIENIRTRRNQATDRLPQYGEY